MGTAPSQGKLWGAHARDWATLMEKAQLPVYRIVLDKANVGRGTRLLDVGCGAGMAAQLAALLGAEVSGLDASEASLVIARERVTAGQFHCGEMEELPYADGAFDVVTGFNSFQFAARPIEALRQARRVTRSGGIVALSIWGRAEDCEFATTLAAVAACLPGADGAAPTAFGLSRPERMDVLMEEAGLALQTSGEIACPFEFPDDATAWRAISSSGPLAAAVQMAGEEVIRQAVMASLAPFRTPSGGYRQENLMRYVIATA